MPSVPDYLATLKDRAKESRVYRGFQLDGLEIAQMLGDEKHRSLYIRLAKIHDPFLLRVLARTISENGKVKNKGAYFMAALKSERDKGNITTIRKKS